MRSGKDLGTDWTGECWSHHIVSGNLDGESLQILCQFTHSEDKSTKFVARKNFEGMEFTVTTF